MSYDPGRPTTDEHLPYFSLYIDLVGAGGAMAQMETGFTQHLERLGALSANQAQHRYAPDKWSVLQTIGHLSDGERVFTYRALRFARGDTTPLEGFDEATWMRNVDFDARDLQGLLDEWRGVRMAALSLFQPLSPEAWLRQGTANGHITSVRALAYMIAGHELHHMKLLRERYGLPV
jgi:DinB superfamily